jgi:hypothetical protein
LSKFVRGRKSGRSSADDGDAFSGRRPAIGKVRIIRFQVPVGDVPFELAHGDRTVCGGSTTASLARLAANASQGGR